MPKKGEINWRIIGRFMGFLLVGNSILMFLAIIPGAIYNDEGWRSLMISGTISLMLGSISLIFTKDALKEIGKREGYLIVTLGWIVLSFSGCLPYILSGTIQSFAGAMFETISGYTTTGATVLEDIEIVPHGILMWRSMTHWVGGMGIIVLTVAILPILGIGGMQLFSAEASGVGTDKLHPRITSTAKRLWLIYFGLTFLQTALLKLAGMDWFDAINHSMATVSTGGFSTKNASIGAYESPWIHYIVIVFMFVSAVNFTLIYWGLKGRLDKIWKNDEFKFYLFLVIGVTLLATVFVQVATWDGNFEKSFRDSLFQVVAVITTTGFATADFTAWSPILTVMFFFLFFTGACAGSTSGGVKLIRHLIIIKNSLMEFKRLLHPAAVIPVRINGHAVKGRVTFNVMAFILIYFGVFVIGTIVMSLLGEDFITSMGASASCLGSVGPGLGDVGPVENYNSISGVGKIFLSFLMLVGRLEIFTVLILFTPYFWSRY
jgi:trk system potassium uptake protein